MLCGAAEAGLLRTLPSSPQGSIPHPFLTQALGEPPSLHLYTHMHVLQPVAQLPYRLALRIHKINPGNQEKLAAHGTKCFKPGNSCHSRSMGLSFIICKIGVSRGLWWMKGEGPCSMLG